MKRVCTRCDSLSGPNASYCSDCGQLLILDAPGSTRISRAKRKKQQVLSTSPQKVLRGPCRYCGVPCVGGACGSHRDLLALDVQ